MDTITSILTYELPAWAVAIIVLLAFWMGITIGEAPLIKNWEEEK